MSVDPVELVDAIEQLGGRHPGRRAAHARGTLCAGRFSAAPDAASLTRAPHMQGGDVRVTVRFSNGSGDPATPDNDRRDGRGMAVKFYLPGGGTSDIVALSLPVFFVRTPEEFLAFTRLRRPDPETGELDMQRIGAFVAEHPATGAALGLIVPALVPPRSYATSAYNSIHAFRLVSGQDEGRWVRWRLDPVAGVEALPEDEIDGAAPDYLQRDIRARLADGPVRFRLVARLAEPGDSLTDPTAAWPEERRRVVVGELELTGLEEGRETGGDVLVFDPTRVCDGIECSDDPILHVRSHAYSVSVERRTGAARPAGL